MNDKHIKVLLIEDSPKDARLIRKMLAEAKGVFFDLESVDQISTAIKRIGEGHIDMILSDLTLLGGQELDAFREVHAKAQSVPIIVLSGLEDEEIAVKAVQEGAQDYLVKGHVDGNLLVRSMRYAIEHKLAEEERMAAVLEKAAIIDAMPGALLVLDLDGRILSVNSTYTKIFGTEPEEIVGKSLADFRVDLKPEDMERAMRTLREVIETGRGTPFEMTIHKKYGGEIPVSATYSIIKDTNDNPKNIVVLVRDISERKKTEEALRSSEERFRMLFEFAPDAYYLSDFEGNFVDGNKAAEELVGYRRDELKGENFLDLGLLPTEYLQKAVEGFTKNIGGVPTGPDEFVLNRKDGTQVPVEIRTFPMNIDGQDLALGIARDITERKRVEDKLRKTVSDLQRFNRLAVGRELRMIELKREVNELLHSMGRQEKYRIPASENIMNKEGG